jgi:hypothetical protein
VKAEVVALTGQLRQLREQFERKTGEALELRQRADLMERRLAAASRLLEGLGSERVRWTADFQVIIFQGSRRWDTKLQLEGLGSERARWTAGFSWTIFGRCRLCHRMELGGKGSEHVQ